MIGYFDYDQGSDDWLQVRAGKATASRYGDVLNRGQGRRRYLLELLAERLTGRPAPSFSNPAMAWGTETEPQARAAYEIATGYEVIETGFVVNDAYPGCGISPDGLIGDTGLLEIKCPNTTTHLDYVLRGKLPAKYVAQVQGQLLITERDWCDFVSFDPRLPTRDLMVIRVEPDREYQSDLALELGRFINELETMEKNIGQS